MEGSTTKRRITLDKSTPPRRKLTGHEYYLQQLKNENKVINLTLASGEEMSGTIDSFDKFTITMNRGGKLRCVFKHSIESFG